MTRYLPTYPETEIAREARTPVRLPGSTSAPIFAGWGPKF